MNGTGILLHVTYAARTKLTGHARTAAKNSPEYDTFDPANRRIITPCGESPKGLTMTDPIAYEAGIIGGVQLDVYDVLALVAQDALADTAAAADEAAEPTMAEMFGYDDFRSLAEYLDDEDESGDDLAHENYLDSFTFLPDDYDRLEV